MATHRLSDVEAVDTLIEARNIVGGLGGLVIPTFAAIGMAESLLDTLAVNVVWKPGTPEHLSMDTGWLQLNSYWNRFDLADIAETFNPLECAVYALSLFKSVKPYGAGYARWTTYKQGRHIPFRPRMLQLARDRGIEGV